MEKEKRGLFRRLLDFWKEREEEIALEKPDFWKKAEEKPGIAELGAVAAISQRETKKAFWEERAEQEEKKSLLFAEELQKRKESPAEEAETEEEKKQRKAEERTGTWLAGEWLKEETEGKQRGFFPKEDVKERAEQRKIIPVAEQKEEKQEAVEEMQEIRPEKRTMAEEKQAEPAIDIEKLMEQMTKRLWEERESSGRRLR